MKVYIASRFSRIQEAEQVIRPALEAIGWTVTSRWHREQADQPVDGAMAHHTAAENGEFALRDLEDVDAADALVLLTEEPESCWPRGARHVDFGWAWKSGKTCLIIGPRENVFHWLLPDSCVFGTVEELIKAFEKEV